MDNGKAQLRSGAQVLKNADMDAVCCHDAGSLGCKIVAVETAVMGNGNALVHSFLTLSHNNIGKCLSCVADYMNVHVVQTQLHGAAKTCSTKGEGCEKSVLDFLFIVSDGVEFCPFTFGKRGAIQPTLVFFLIASH